MKRQDKQQIRFNKTTKTWSWFQDSWWNCSFRMVQTGWVIWRFTKGSLPRSNYMFFEIMKWFRHLRFLKQICCNCITGLDFCFRHVVEIRRKNTIEDCLAFSIEIKCRTINLSDLSSQLNIRLIYYFPTSLVSFLDKSCRYHNF